MRDIIAILAFTVVIPFAVGLRFYRRIPTAYRVIVHLCGLWFVAEVYSYILRMNNMMNAHISYILTPFEIFFFASFYAKICHDRSVGRVIHVIGLSGFLLVAFDYLVFKTPFNTFSLSIEYVLLTAFALYIFYEIINRETSADYSLINFTLLFYLLSSFPYFFAWDLLRTRDLKLLTVLASIHSYVHAMCYQIMAYALWRSSLSYSARS